MEIDITSFMLDADPFDFSASRAERGDDAGPQTWRNAMREADTTPLLTTSDQLDALRQWARESGGWTRKEIAAWSDQKCNALFIQIISGNMREAGMDECDLEDFDWAAYEEAERQGRISGGIYRTSDGKFFFYLGS